MVGHKKQALVTYFLKNILTTNLFYKIVKELVDDWKVIKMANEIMCGCVSSTSPFKNKYKWQDYSIPGGLQMIDLINSTLSHIITQADIF